MRAFKIATTVLFLLVSAVTSWAGKTDDVMNDIIKQKGKVTIGIIVDVKNKDAANPVEASLMITDLLQKESMKIYPRNKVAIVDRNQLKRIIDEQKLRVSGLTDDDAFRIGKIAGIDILFLYTYYNEDYVSFKTLSVETGEVLDIHTPEVKMLVNDVAIVQPQKHVVYDWTLNKGQTLKISIDSKTDVNVYLLDDVNFTKYKKRQDFTFFKEASGKRIFNANYELKITESGSYHFVIDNRMSIISSKAVTIKARTIDGI